VVVIVRWLPATAPTGIWRPFRSNWIRAAKTGQSRSTTPRKERNDRVEILSAACLEMRLCDPGNGLFASCLVRNKGVFVASDLRRIPMKTAPGRLPPLPCRWPRTDGSTDSRPARRRDGPSAARNDSAGWPPGRSQQKLGSPNTPCKRSDRPWVQAASTTIESGPIDPTLVDARRGGSHHVARP